MVLSASQSNHNLQTKQVCYGLTAPDKAWTSLVKQILSMTIKYINTIWLDYFKDRFIAS